MFDGRQLAMDLALTKPRVRALIMVGWVRRVGLDAPEPAKFAGEKAYQAGDLDLMAESSRSGSGIDERPKSQSASKP
jgi:hypothetical protein